MAGSIAGSSYSLSACCQRSVARFLAAAELPILVVLPIRYERPVECVFVPLHRMRFAEEVPAGRDALDGVESKLLLIDDDGLEEFDHHLQHLHVEHQLFE